MKYEGWTNIATFEAAFKIDNNQKLFNSMLEAKNLEGWLRANVPRGYGINGVNFSELVEHFDTKRTEHANFLKNNPVTASAKFSSRES